MWQAAEGKKRRKGGIRRERERRRLRKGKKEGKEMKKLIIRNKGACKKVWCYEREGKEEKMKMSESVLNPLMDTKKDLNTPK